MGLRGLFEGWHIVILVVVVVLVFGWKRLPDAARSLGRSMRIFKAEVGEMKNDAKPQQPSAAASDTVRGQTVQQPPTAAGTTPPVQPTPPAAPVDDPTLTPPATHSAAPGSQPSQQPPA
jgi:sec-independent protein translocase protein TatA